MGLLSSLLVAPERVMVPELMDDPELDENKLRAALDSLRRINSISNTTPRIERTIRTLAQPGDRALRILDVGTGSGDLPLALAARAKRKGLNWQLIGSDISSNAISYAQERATRQQLPVEFITHDAFADPFPENCDVIVNSLFLHHMTDEQAAVVMSRMQSAAGQMVIVDDLCRTNWGLWLAMIGTRLLSRSHIVHVDGPRSVRAAFTPSELQELAAKSAMQGHQLTRHWPQRQLLVWRNT